MANNEQKPMRVYHFTDDFTVEEITEYMSMDENALYFTRSVGNDLHVVKHNPKGVINISELETQLLNHYSKSNEMVKYIKDAKVKGNSNFGIIQNLDEATITKFKDDLNKLLIK